MKGISKKGVPIGLSIWFSERPPPPTNNRGKIILGKVPFDYIEKWMVVFMGLKCPPHTLENFS